MKIDSINPIAGLDFSDDSKGVFKGLEAVVFRLTTSITGSDDPLGGSDNDWEVADDTSPENALGVVNGPEDFNFVKVGDGTTGDGIFTFQKTGYYLIFLNGNVYNTGANGRAGIFIKVDDGSGYSAIGTSYQTINTAISNGNSNLSLQVLIKVDGTAIDNKLKMEFTTSDGGDSVQGDTTSNLTSLTFIKLADI